MSEFSPRRDGPVLLLGLVLVSGCVGCSPRAGTADDSSWSLGDGPASCPGQVIRAIAVENQYGSLVSRLGGQGVLFKSIINNPAADPHEFQTNFQVVQDYQGAQLVVENGLGYDDFSDKIIETIARKPKVVNAGDVLGLKSGDNPHVWYDPDAVDRLCPGDHGGAEGTELRRVGLFRRSCQGLRRAPRTLPRGGCPHPQAIHGDSRRGD